MARLGDVVVGLLNDVLRARAAADAATAQLADAYREDPMLAALSVPRITVPSVTLRLRYVVTDVVAERTSGPQVRRAVSTWNAQLRGDVLTGLQAALGTPVDEDVDLLRAALEADPVAVPQEVLEQAIEGSAGALVTLGVDGVLEAVRGLPPTTRRRFGPLRSLREALTAAVSGATASMVKQLGLEGQSPWVLDSRLEVDVRGEAVQSAPASAVQELELTFALDDVEDFVDVGNRR